MSKKIQVDLTFKADTQAAKQQLQQLQQQLNKIMTQPMEAKHMNVMRNQISEAVIKAGELKVALQNATNVDTGRLNFGKFSQQLKQNKMTLADYGKSLKALGPEGAKAFQGLAQAISNSETPLISLQGKAAALGKTLMNTARWMLSSSMLQGFSSALSNTVNYAKELNKSLNDIRIVTGKNTESVSKFAEQANKTAKNLSTTTNEYAKASLIYYQQGLSDQEVAQRTATTIKLANAVGKSAEEVSEWMTAIWNNFDDGSRSMEQYADVLAKLGAATASSADEIAGGLEKFSAVADSVGLSYEYAASALATITAETRQSEDVVGTALKTIFARVENLKLGETLEDGTSLGQYSAALEKVGVNIKESNGGLKDMDEILDNIGARWQSLAQDEQVALAQSVAGIRQYNQFIALMDNYDTMKENVELAKESRGELELQNEIYSQGIEGTTKRVQANLEEIKNTLLDENDLVPMLEMANGFLTVIGDILDAIGGLPSLLGIIATVGLKIWGPQVAQGLQSAVTGIQNLFGVASGRLQEERSKMVTEATSQAKKMYDSSNMGNNEAAMRTEYLGKEIERKQKLQDIESKIPAYQREVLNLTEQTLKMKEEEAIAAAKAADEYERAAQAARSSMEHSGYYEAGLLTDMKNKNYGGNVTAINDDFEKVNKVYTEQKAKGNINQDDQDKYNTAAFNLKNANQNYMTKDAELRATQAQLNNTNLTDDQRKNLEAQEKSQSSALSKAQTEMENAAQKFANVAKSITAIATQFEGNAKLQGLEDAAHYKNKVATMEEHRYDSGNALLEDINSIDKQIQPFRSDIDPNLLAKYDQEKQQAQQSAEDFKKADEAVKDQDTKVKELEEKYGKKPKDQGQAKQLEEEKAKLKALNEEREKAQTHMRTSAKSYAATAKNIDVADKALKNFTKDIDKNTEEGKAQIKNAENYVRNIEQQDEALKKEGAAVKEANALNKAYEEQLKAAADAKKTWADSLVIVGQHITSAATGVNMLTNSFNSLSDAIANGEVGFSTILSTIMTMSMAIPMVINGFGGIASSIGAGIKAFKASKQVQDQHNKSTSTGITLSKLFTKAGRDEIRQTREASRQKRAEEKKNQGEDAKSAMAKVAKKFAEHPILGAAILATVVALLGVAVAVSVDAKSEEKAREEAKAQSAEKVKELAEQVKANGELFKSYRENLEIFEETGQGKEKLIEISKKICEAYGLEGAALAQLSGDYDRLTDSIEEARKAELQDTINAAQDDIDLNWDDFDDTMTDAGSQHIGDSQYQVDINAQNAGWLDNLFGRTGWLPGYNEGQDIKEFLTEFRTENLDFLVKQGLLDFKTNQTGGFQFYLDDRQDAKTYAKAYETMQLIAEKMSKDPRTKNTGEYEAVRWWLANSKENYEKYEENYKIITESQAELDVLEKVSDKGKKVSKIIDSDLQDYLTYRKKVLGDLEKDSDEYTARIQKLNEQTNTSQLELYAQAIDKQSQWFANVDTGVGTLTKLYISSSAAMRAAMAMVQGEEGAAYNEDSFMNAAQAYLVSTSRSTRVSNAMDKNIGYTERQSNAIYRLYKTSKQLDTELKDNEVLLNQISDEYTTLYARTNNFTKVWKEQSAALAAGNENIVEYGLALGKVSEAAMKLFRINNKDFDMENFIHTNLDTFKALMQGEESALATLQSELGLSMASGVYQNIEGVKLLIKEIGDVEDYVQDETKILDDEDLLKQWQQGGEHAYAMRDAAEAIGFLIEEVKEGLQITYAQNSNALQNYFKEARKELEKLLKGLDRYWYLKQKIEDSSNRKSMIEQLRDDALGKGQRDASAAYMAELEHMSELEAKYYEQAQKDYGKKRTSLLANWTVELDDNGVITNQNELEEKFIRDGNDKLLEEFRNEAKEYTDALNLYEEKHYKQINQENEKFSERLAEIGRAMEYDLKIDDSALVAIDFQLQQIEDDAYKAAEALDLINQRTEKNVNKFNSYRQAFDETLKAAGLSKEEITALLTEENPDLDSILNGKDIDTKVMTQLETIRDGMIKTQQALYEDRVQQQEILNKLIEQNNEDIAEEASKFERYASVIKNYKNIADIAGRDNVGFTDEISQTIRETQIANSRNSLIAAKNTMEANKKVLDEAEAQLNAARKSENDLAIKQWEETFKLAIEQYNESYDAFQNNWRETLQLTADLFAEHLEDIADSFSEAMGGIFGSLENMREAFDRQMELSERYLQNFEKTYEISKLNRSIEEKLEKTDNLQTQARLVDLQQDLLAMNKEGVKVSQRDIEYMQKKYDLLIAEDALRDAQNAKSTVRLKRDSEGNFGYMYTADEAATEKAKQGYEDALYALQKFSDDTDKELAEMLLATNEKAYEAIQELGDMASWTQEEWNTNMANLSAEYGEDIEYILSEYQKLLDRNKKSNTQYYADLAETFNDTYVNGIYPDYEDFVSLQGDLTTQLEGHCGRANTAFTGMKTTIDGIFGDAGIDGTISNFADTVDSMREDIEEDSSLATTAIQTMADNMVTKITGENGIVKSIQAWDTNWGTVYTNITTQAGDIADSLSGIYSWYTKLGQVDLSGLELPGTEGGTGTGGKQTGATGGGGLSTKYAKGQIIGGKDNITIDDKTYVRVKGADGSTTNYVTENQLYSNNKGSAYSGTFKKGDQVYYDSAVSGMTKDEVYKKEGYLRKADYTAPKIRYYGAAWETETGGSYDSGEPGMFKVSDDEYYVYNEGAIEEDRNDKNYFKITKPNEVAKLTKEGEKQFALFANQEKAEMPYKKGQQYSGVYAPTSGITGGHSSSSYRVTAEGSNHENIMILGYRVINGNIYALVDDIGGNNAGFKTGSQDNAKTMSVAYVPMNIIDFLNKNKDGVGSITAFDTGGYTGNWGPEGRMAMLHQKEIVLNAHDTENLLIAVEIVRDISNQLEKSAIAMQYASSLNTVRASITPSNDTLQQEVTIHAEFPNATDHNEIEEAFRNLTNLASQYVSRR